MKIALIHDHLNQYGGAERVLKAFSEIWPQAPIYTLVYDQEKMERFFPPARIRTSFIQRIPGGLRFFRWFLRAMPLATETYNLNEFNVVLSSSSAFAKGVITRPETLHICYCHSPTRYLWRDTHSYVDDLSYNKLTKKVILWSLNQLRNWDRMAADRVDQFVANSQEVRRRIIKYYRRQSELIYPPVDALNYEIAENLGNYYFVGGRLVAYKRYDLVVEAFNRLGIPLKIFGDGPEFDNLRQRAKKNIEFLGRITDEEKARLYSQALAFIQPQVEDLGITPLESMAAGRPVIAYAQGGALETIIDGVTGKFFLEQDYAALADTIIRFQPENFDPRRIRNHALWFDVEQFKIRVKKYVEETWEKFQAVSRKI